MHAIQVDPALFSYPIFNVADIWIVIGVGLLLIDNFRHPRNALVKPTSVVPVSAR